MSFAGQGFVVVQPSEEPPVQGSGQQQQAGRSARRPAELTRGGRSRANRARLHPLGPVRPVRRCAAGPARPPRRRSRRRTRPAGAATGRSPAVSAQPVPRVASRGSARRRRPGAAPAAPRPAARSATCPVQSRKKTYRPRALAGRAGLDPGQVDPAYGQLGQHREQRADPVVGDVDGQRGDVVAGRRRRRRRAGRPARTGSPRRGGRRSCRPARVEPVPRQPRSGRRSPRRTRRGRGDRRRPRRWRARRPPPRPAGGRAASPGTGWTPAGGPPPCGPAPAAVRGRAREHELHRQHHLAGDHQRARPRPARPGSRRPPRRSSSPAAPARRRRRRPGRVQRLGHAAGGRTAAPLGGGDGAQGLLGEGALGAEVDEARGRCSGHADQPTHPARPPERRRRRAYGSRPARWPGPRWCTRRCRR